MPQWRCGDHLKKLVNFHVGITEVFLEVAAWEKRIKGRKKFQQVLWLGKGLVEEISIGQKSGTGKCIRSNS